jgi:hypothetical protein
MPARTKGRKEEPEEDMQMVDAPAAETQPEEVSQTSDSPVDQDAELESEENSQRIKIVGHSVHPPSIASDNRQLISSFICIATRLYGYSSFI